MAKIGEGDTRDIVAEYQHGYCEAPGNVLADNPAETSIIIFDRGDPTLACDYFEGGNCNATSPKSACKVLFDLQQLLLKREKVDDNDKIRFAFSPGEGEETIDLTYDKERRIISGDGHSVRLSGKEG